MGKKPTIEMVNLKAVTFQLPEWVHQQAKVSAAIKGVRLQEYIADAIAQKIRREKTAKG